MTITSYEIELLAKTAASAYLRDKVPLDESITKMAEDRHLNYEQTQRVAEEANTQVYLNLFNQASPENRYIEFPIANIKKIAGSMQEKVKSAGLIPYLPRFSDYFLPPQTNYIPACSQAKEESEKLASIQEMSKGTEPPMQSQYAEQFAKLHKQAEEKLYQNAIFEIGFAVEKQANYLIDTAKQDILSKNGCYEEIEQVFNDVFQARPKIAAYLLEQLSKPIGLTKLSGYINREHWFYKEIQKLAKLLDEYDAAKLNPKVAHKKISSVGTAVGLGVGLPASAAAAIGIHEAYKTKRQTQTSPLVLQNPGINKVK